MLRMVRKSWRSIDQGAVEWYAAKEARRKKAKAEAAAKAKRKPRVLDLDWQPHILGFAARETAMLVEWYAQRNNVSVDDVVCVTGTKVGDQLRYHIPLFFDYMPGGIPVFTTLCNPDGRRGLKFTKGGTILVGISAVTLTAHDKVRDKTLCKPCATERNRQLEAQRRNREEGKP